ncbi:Coiled-coil domain-containing protein, partial [Operophtera brumata]
MHARELLSVESLETMKKTVTKLEKELDALKRAGDDDALEGELDGIRIRLSNALSYQEELEQRNTEAEENESNTLKSTIEARVAFIESLTDKLNKADKTIEHRDKQLRDMTIKLETAKVEQEAATAKATHFRETLDLTNNMASEGKQLRNDIMKLTKQGIQQYKKYQVLEKKLSNVESERDRLRQQVSVMERDLMLGKKQAESDKRDIENLNREKDILNKSMQKIQSGSSADAEPSGTAAQAADTQFSFIKEVGLKSCEGTLAKCNKKNEQLRADVQAGLLKLSEAKAEITALTQEEAKLNRCIQ